MVKVADLDVVKEDEGWQEIDIPVFVTAAESMYLQDTDILKGTRAAGESNV